MDLHTTFRFSNPKSELTQRLIQVLLLLLRELHNIDTKTSKTKKFATANIT